MRKSFLSLFTIDPRSLAAFRIGLGCLLMVDLAVRVRDLVAHYSDTGAVPRAVMVEYRPDALPWSLHMLHGSTAYVAILFAVAAVAATCLMIGWRTRLATVISWILLVSLHVRNPLLLNGGDVLLRMLLFWSMFLPMGSHWSTDQWCRPEKAPPSPIHSVAAACLLLQVCLVYWMSGYWKLTGTWGQPDVLLQIMQFDTYAKAPAYALQHFPGVLAIIGQVILWTELIGPCLVWLPVWHRPMRLLVITAFFLLHAGIELTLTVGLFSYACWLAWIPFLPETFWDSILKVRRQAGAEHASRDCGSDALPPDCYFRGYHRSGRPWGGPAWLSAVGLVLLLGWNVTWSDNAPWLPRSVQSLTRIALVEQKWNLFSNPPKNDGWHVVVAHLKNGQAVDLLREGQAADWSSFRRPAFSYRRYPNHRWRKYYRRLISDSRDCFRGPLCEYLARDWNRAHGESEQAVRIVMHFMAEIGGETPPDRFCQRILNEWNCPSQKLTNDEIPSDERMITRILSRH